MGDDGCAKVSVVRTSRQRLLFSTLAAVAVLLTGTACATTATSAAIVGDATIAEQTIFDRTAQASAQLSDAGRAPGVDQLAALNRVQTTIAVRSALLADAAKDLGVVVTDAQVNAAMRGPLSGTTGSDRQAYRDQLLLEGALSAHGAEPLTFTNVTLTLDGARTSSRDAAVNVQRTLLAAPADAPVSVLDQAVEPLSTTSVDLSAPVNMLLDGVAAARPGDVLLNQDTDGTFYVIRVVDRTEAPAQVSATAILAQDIDLQQQVGTVALLQAYAEHIGVSVNPRMGVWDPTSLQVVPTPTAS